MKEDITVQPTHTCFDDMPWMMAQMIKEKRDFRLCHGIMVNDNGPYSHAWIEFDDTAIFAGMLKGQKVYLYVEKESYLKDAKCIKATRYTRDEAMAASKADNGTTGPWVQEYKELTNDYKGKKNEETTSDNNTSNESSAEARL